MLPPASAGEPCTAANKLLGVTRAASPTVAGPICANELAA
jgi:hypothetical protein